MDQVYGLIEYRTSTEYWTPWIECLKFPKCHKMFALLKKYSTPVVPSDLTTLAKVNMKSYGVKTPRVLSKEHYSDALEDYEDKDYPLQIEWYMIRETLETPREARIIFWFEPEDMTGNEAKF